MLIDFGEELNGDPSADGFGFQDIDLLASSDPLASPIDSSGVQDVDLLASSDLLSSPIDSSGVQDIDLLASSDLLASPIGGSGSGPGADLMDLLGDFGGGSAGHTPGSAAGDAVSALDDAFLGSLFLSPSGGDAALQTAGAMGNASGIAGAA
eukprot:1401623-Prymnesium_polylepis.1